MLRTFIGFHRVPQVGRGTRQLRSIHKNPWCCQPAGGASTGLVAGGHAAKGVKAPAAWTRIVIGWHVRAMGDYFRSGEIGI